jgi:putative flavoprotein involved in K+ transport
MSNYQKPRVPAFARELSADIVQLHSLDYRRPSQLRDGPVLVVGAAHSGADVAIEMAAEHETILCGRDTGQVPFDIDGLAARLLLVRLVLRVVFHRILTVATPIGRRVRPRVLHTGGALVRLKPAWLARGGVQRVGRVAGVRDGRPMLDDGRVLDVANVIWCTGFHHGFSWIDLPVFGPDGDPVHVRGAATGMPGLSFVGLHFLYALSSGMIHGVGRDAARVARSVAASRARTAAELDRAVPRLGDRQPVQGTR